MSACLLVSLSVPSNNNKKFTNLYKNYNKTQIESVQLGKAFDLKLNFQFPCTPGIGLMVLSLEGWGGDGGELYFLALERPTYQVIAFYLV